MKKLLVVLLAAVMLAVGANAAFEKVNTYSGNFSDVKETNWFYDNVKTAYELGFMNGKAEGKFDPNGNVTVAEGITMASRLHAIYNNTEVSDESVVVNEHKIDFNEGEDGNLMPKRATAKLEDGVLILQPDAPNANGAYDPQLTIKNLSLQANLYNKVTFRMKREDLPNVDNKNRANTIEFFFQTSTEPSITESKAFFLKYNDVTDNPYDWFDVVIEVGEHTSWKDTITGLRFDPSNDNGIYYIDYISFSKSENKSNTKWYDMYVNYALDRKIIQKGTYTAEDMTRNITRAEMCDLFAGALPSEYYNAINDIKGIPDVLRDSKNADVYLMLYKAGILLGSDEKGTFNATSDIKRSEVAAIINRVALPENRVKGTIPTDWSEQGNEYDIEFNDESYLESLTYEAESVEIVDGALVLKAKDRGENRQPGSPQFDPKITVKDINVDAAMFSKLKVRMKVDFIGDITSTRYDFYFMTEGDENFSETKSMHQDFVKYSYLDPAGWYVMEVDFRNHGEWKGKITSFRFDPCNTNGVYTIDYIRLALGDPLRGASHDLLVSEGYTATGLLQDPDFERGFYVCDVQQKKKTTEHGLWQDYSETTDAPLWRICPWFTKQDLWLNRDTTTDKYTLKDTYGINTITYNPEEKSISMRLDATKVYNGEPHDKLTYNWWPHLLLDQGISFAPVDTDLHSVADKKLFFEIDARITDFKDTINPEGTNHCSFLIYFYLRHKDIPDRFIYFGIRLFNGLYASTDVTPGWAPDSAASMYMYGIPQATIFGDVKNSFNPEKNVVAVGDEWKHVRLDVTHHIANAIEWANRDNIFGFEVSPEDMYIGGVNIGYEVHGNYDMTMEFKNFDMVSYSKAE